MEKVHAMFLFHTWQEYSIYSFFPWYINMARTSNRK